MHALLIIVHYSSLHYFKYDTILHGLYALAIKTEVEIFGRPRIITNME